MTDLDQLKITFRQHSYTNMQGLSTDELVGLANLRPVPDRVGKLARNLR